MHYIYTLKLISRLSIDANWTAIDNKIIDEHFNYLKRLLDENVLILAGRTLNEDESKFGIVIFEADTMDSAKMIMLNDPVVKESIMTAVLYPYRVALVR